MAVGRRGALAGAALLLAARRARAMPDEHLAYVAGAQGITLWRVNTGDGALRRLSIAAIERASWLARDAHGRTLYAVMPGEPEGRVSAFAIERGSGALVPRNAVAAHGAAPCFVSVHPSEKFVLVANGGGSVAVFPVSEAGALGDASDVQGQPAKAASGMVASDPAGRFILATDTTGDRILRFTLDAASGKLAASGDPVPTAPGSSPDRFVFAPHGRVLYVLQSRAATVTAYDYDGETGALRAVQDVSVLPPGYAGGFAAADLLLTADGRFLYASVQLHDAITIFAVGEAGRLTRIGETWTRADDPGSFTLAPDGNMLFACDRRAGTITSFRVSRLSGAVDFVGQYAAVGSPACMVFLD